MRRVVPSCAFATACLFAVTLSAQDTTMKSKTKVKADDGKVVTLTGCLQPGTDGTTFTLANASAIGGDEMETRAKTEVDVDDDDIEVKDKSRTKVEDGVVGTSGSSYTLTAGSGVDLTAHVGHTVEISAIMPDAKKGGDDDTTVTMKDKTKVKVEDGPDSKIETKTKAELPRGAGKRLSVVSLKHVSPTCTP